MAKWKSVTGLYPIGRLPNTELVGVKRGNTYYARSYVVPSNPKTDRQRVVRAAHMVIGNALYRMSKDPVAREWKKTLQAITGVDDVRRAWIALVARAYDADSQSFQFPPEFSPASGAAIVNSSASGNNVRVVTDLDGTELEVVAYAAVQNIGQTMAGTWARTVDVPTPIRVHAGTADWEDTEGSQAALGNKILTVADVDEIGDAFVGIFFVKVLAESWEFWSPNGTITIHPVRFGYVANVAPNKDIFCFFGPGGVVHQDWTGIAGGSYKFVYFATPSTLQPQPENYPYHVYKVQASIVDARTPQSP